MIFPTLSFDLSIFLSFLAVALVVFRSSSCCLENTHIKVQIIRALLNLTNAANWLLVYYDPLFLSSFFEQFLCNVSPFHWRHFDMQLQQKHRCK